MPSDDRTRRALDALAAHRERYRSAVSAAHDQMAGYLAAHRARSHGHALIASKELGRFASGRIDVERFGALFANMNLLSTETTERIERLVGVLAELLADGDDLFTCEVPPGGDLRRAVDDALAQAGRAFGAVLGFQAVKTGVYRPERHDADIITFPFARWNRSERLLGLPLVVEVNGADVRAEELAQFLDGRVAIVLVVRGESTPAPLVRLLTPGMLVIQASDVAELSTLTTHDGPAVAAMLAPNAARFTHEPRAGRSLRERLAVRSTPPEPPKQPLGGRSVWQQVEELALLEELDRLARGSAALAPAIAVAGGPSAPAAAPSASGAVDPGTAEALASWLLGQAGLATDNGDTPGAAAR